MSLDEQERRVYDCSNIAIEIKIKRKKYYIETELESEHVHCTVKKFEKRERNFLEDGRMKSM